MDRAVNKMVRKYQTKNRENNRFLKGMSQLVFDYT